MKTLKQSPLKDHESNTDIEEPIQAKMCVCVSVTQAHVVFKPTLQQQRKCANCTDSAIDGTFTVVYDVNREGNTGELQVGGVRFIQLLSSVVSAGAAVTFFCPPGVRRPLRPVLRSNQPLAASQEHRICH